MNVQALEALTEQTKHCCTILKLGAIQCLGEDVSSHIMCCNKGRSNQAILHSIPEPETSLQSVIYCYSVNSMCLCDCTRP